jgi:hypothetical protein
VVSGVNGGRFVLADVLAFLFDQLGIDLRPVRGGG